MFMIDIQGNCIIYSDYKCTLDKQEKLSILREFFNSKKIIDHRNEPSLSYGKVVFELNKKHKINLSFVVPKKP